MGCQCTNYSLVQDSKEITKTKNESSFTSKDPNTAKISNDTFNKDFLKLEQSNLIKNSIPSSLPLTDKTKAYILKAFELINSIRRDPLQYAYTVQREIQNIQMERHITQDKITGEEIEIYKLIYKKKLKVALVEGEEAFYEASELLKNTEPMLPFDFKRQICIPIPTSIEQIKDSSYLKEQVKEIKNNYDICVYFKDLIKDPDIAILLMVVDDNGKINKKKRNAVLNPRYKYIGISCGYIDNIFIAYFTFSDI